MHPPAHPRRTCAPLSVFLFDSSLFIHFLFIFINSGLSREYFEKGFLDFTDRVEDGFYDAGRSGEFKPFEELISLDRAREVRPPHKCVVPRVVC